MIKNESCIAIQSTQSLAKEFYMKIPEARAEETKGIKRK